MCKIKLIIDTTDTAEGEWALDPARLLVWASLVIQMVKNLLAMWETWVQSLGWENPWRRERLPTLAFWPGEFHEQRSLAGYSSWGHKESDTTEQPSLSLVSLQYMTTGKTIAMTIWTFVDKVMSLILNMLPRFVTAFFPRSK